MQWPIKCLWKISTWGKCIEKNYESMNLIWLSKYLGHFDDERNRLVKSHISIRITADYKFLHGSWEHKEKAQKKWINFDWFSLETT